LNEFEVDAPPGVLRLVLETSDKGVPVVHAIKKTSCLALEVEVGDHLVAVDGEDVRAMLLSLEYGYTV
jgi:C-terminal processing protease CtpA/Prc